MVISGIARSETAVGGNVSPGAEVIKLFSYSTQLNTKFILLINVKTPTIVGVLTFISMINAASERLKARNIFIYRYFSVHEQLKFHAQLSGAWNKFYNLGAWPFYKQFRNNPSSNSIFHQMLSLSLLVATFVMC